MGYCSVSIVGDVLVLVVVAVCDSKVRGVGMVVVGVVGVVVIVIVVAVLVVGILPDGHLTMR